MVIFILLPNKRYYNCIMFWKSLKKLLVWHPNSTLLSLIDSKVRGSGDVVNNSKCLRNGGSEIRGFSNWKRRARDVSEGEVEREDACFFYAFNFRPNDRLWQKWRKRKKRWNIIAIINKLFEWGREMSTRNKLEKLWICVKRVGNK